MGHYAPPAMNERETRVCLTTVVESVESRASGGAKLVHREVAFAQGHALGRRCRNNHIDIY